MRPLQRFGHPPTLRFAPLGRAAPVRITGHGTPMNSIVGRHSILFLALAACLTGCGGGGSGAGVRESAPMMPSAPRQPDPAPEPAPAPAAPKCVDPGMTGAAGAPACSIQYTDA